MRASTQAVFIALSRVGGARRVLSRAVPWGWLWGAVCVLFLVMGVMGVMGVPAARALGLNFSGAGGNSPIDIEADNGIEWQQRSLMFIARGNARASRGNVTIRADQLRAYYRQIKGGGTEIWRLDALGHVQITTPGETAYGGHAVYDVDNAVLVLSEGHPVRLLTPTTEITAQKQIEYWDKKQVAVARGHAQVVQDTKKLSGDVITARIRKNAQGKSEIWQVEAFDNVVIHTAQDVVTAARGVYNLTSGVAHLSGSVTITRGPNRLNGCRADVNLKTGISTLLSCPGASSPVSGGGGRAEQGGGAVPGNAAGGRVHGVLIPNSKLKGKP